MHLRVVVVVAIFAIFIKSQIKERIAFLVYLNWEELEKPWELVFGTLKP